MTSALVCPSVIEMMFEEGTRLTFECELGIAHRGLHTSPGKAIDGSEYTVTWAADVKDRAERNQELRQMPGYKEAEVSA